VISEIVDRQLIDQQAIDAANVKGSALWSIEGAAARAGDSVVSTVSSPLVWLAVGLGAFALVAVASGSPRRYGP
jgi:hypothetical protein